MSLMRWLRGGKVRRYVRRRISIPERDIQLELITWEN